MRHLTLALFSAAILAVTSHANAYDKSEVVTGGVGEEARDVIENQEANYNVKLVFTGKGGIYLSNVEVDIKDTKGESVIHGVTQGPFLLADLTPGRYTVEANAEGNVKSQKITVAKSGKKTYQMVFPISDDNDSASLNDPMQDGAYTLTPQSGVVER